ncbi:phosphate ABC transporter substrate-binding protein PstS [Marinifilum caeruleilacunae]|uniref:Phosphate-binding protein n=1 Tax=Marinifilum caeruleilacunae TaxID=2499076 RepID=A0ABX1WR61_9BACT|nr:phosphate ABC transporter substrate-binding protein PstS [Marinifilum caeruleilacunae]NOU58572.1 phosphate ABC transporter substrate-binding protein PstS [Marinifilum caeruleilacunae]
MKKFQLLFAAIIALALMASCGNAGKDKAANNKKAKTITGAGATFPYPFYNKIFKSYTKEQGILVTYGAIGSGGGVRSITDKIVDFGASDAFLNDKKLASMPAEVLHVPTCLGAVVAAYNLPGKPELKFTPELMEGVFMGKITNWNDAKIAEVNPGVTLPDMEITVVYRSDGSGTTFIFSDYMSKISKEWEEKVGKGKALKWPVGIGAKGNPGVAGTISQTEGAIGYIGSEYAFSMGIQMAQIKNQAGNYILPSTESISAAAKGEMPADTRVSLTNTDAADGYPLSSFTWLVIYKEQNYNDRSLDQATQTIKLIDWVVSADAQKETTKVHYAPLPDAAVEKAKAVLGKVTYNGKAIKL